MNPEEAGNYIADIINKNRQSGETNNQVLTRLFQELIEDSDFWFWENFQLEYNEHLSEREKKHSDLIKNFNVEDLYKNERIR